MKIKLTFEYEEQYLPTPRCRKLRTRIVEGTATATIKEITEDKAPIACIVHDGFDFYCEPGPDGHLVTTRGEILLPNVRNKFVIAVTISSLMAKSGENAVNLCISS